MDLLRSFRGVVRESIPVPRSDWVGGSGVPSGPTGFNAATNGRRLSGYAGTTRGINSLALGDGSALRARSRKAAIDNPWAVTAIRGFRSDVIGGGIRPHFQHPKRKTRALLKKLWDRWTDEADSSFDSASRKCIRNFYAQQAYVAGEVMEAGEAFGRFRVRYQSDGLTVPLQIQLIDAEQLPFWKQDGGLPGNIVRGSIEFDALNRRVAYHMYRQNPGDLGIWPDAMETVRIPDASVLHVFDPLRSNPIRGITWLASILVSLEDFRQFEDATVLRQKLSGFFIGWTKRKNPTEPLFPATPPPAGSRAPEGVGFSDVEPGTILELDDHDDIGFNDPPDVGATYAEFTTVQLRKFARVLLRGYHQLSGDVSKANFSSIRADMVNLRRELEQFQFNVMATQFCNPVLKAWLDQAALSGAIDSQDYQRNPWDYFGVQWRTARWDWVNPVDDIQAEKMMNRAGYKSRSQTILEMGGDPEQVDAEIKADQDRADADGLVYDSDGRRPDGKSAVDVSPEAEEDADPQGANVPPATKKKKSDSRGDDTNED